MIPQAKPLQPQQEHQVVIAGGGPTGLMLAAELALAKVNVAVVERRESNDLAGLRAGGIQSRTLEVLDQRGIVDRFISQGQTHQRAPFADLMLPTGDLPTRRNYFLALWQIHVERILAEWAAELGVTTYRGQQVTSFEQNASGVDTALSGGQTLRAQYLIGCDGGRSIVRKKAGIDFPGWDPSASYLIAEAEMVDDPVWGVRRSNEGINAIAKIEDNRVRLVVSEPQVDLREQPAPSDLSKALNALYGTDFGLRNVTYISRFTNMARQAATYRKGRVVLAGDAAHVHSPVGGQGLNLGVQDAVNLGWKLAQVVHGISPESLLDTYHAERHPVGARVLRNTRALTALERGDESIGALREMVSDLIQTDEARKRYFAMMTALDIHYDFGEGHPLLGRRMPDLDLVTDNGPLRVFTLLHQARPVLLTLAEPAAFDITPWAPRVQLVHAKYNGTLELPVLGAVPTPPAVLVRPDGYVAWVGTSSDPALPDALTKWFGPPAGA